MVGSSSGKGDLKNGAWSNDDDTSSLNSSGMGKKKNSFLKKKGEKKGFFGMKTSRTKPGSNQTWKDDSSQRSHRSRKMDPAQRPIEF